MRIIFNVQLYSAKYLGAWDSFITNAKNATFLFHREFMEYHQDRFEDFSLMVYKNDNLIAVLPANRLANEVYSHQGLSYGGLVLQNAIKLKDVIGAFEAILQFLESQQVTLVHIKLLPEIYHKYPSKELDYVFFILKADLYRRDVLVVINNSKKALGLSKIRKRGLKKAQEHGLVVKEEVQLEKFWNEILIPNLEKTHKVKPVHSIEEITKLQKMFPNSIRQFNVYYNNEIVAGTTLFITDTVVHAQYISANETRQDLGSLDFLFHTLINNQFKDKEFFDFGVSNENNGKTINEGLLYWKESFGARTLVQDFYTVNVNNHKLLKSILF